MATNIQLNRRVSHRIGRDFKMMSEINVTPFVDVMLVLLIVFMVTAPLLTVGVQVDLPKTKAGVLQGQDEPLAITIDAQGNLFLQETKIDLERLVPRLIAISENKSDVRIFVRGDQNILYGQIMTVMGVINRAGFTNVALLTKKLQSNGSGR